VVPRLRTMQIWERGTHRVVIAGKFVMVVNKRTGRSWHISLKRMRCDMGEHGYDLVDQVRYRMSKRGQLL